MFGNLVVRGIRKGDKVKVGDADHCYFNYSQFIKLHPQYMLRWAYKTMPNLEHDYTVLGVHHHVMKDPYDNNKTCVVLRDDMTNQIFLIGENGLITKKEYDALNNAEV